MVQLNPYSIAIVRYNYQMFPWNYYSVFRIVLGYCRPFPIALVNDMFNSVITCIYPDIRYTRPFRYCAICMGSAKYHMPGSYDYWN